MMQNWSSGTGDGVLAALLAVLGLCVGSFLNVVIHRLPVIIDARRRAAEETATAYNLMGPPSACPACGHKLRLHEMVPVLSYVWLHGRCSACGWSISCRYLVVEMLGGVLPVLLVMSLESQLQAIAAIVFVWFAIGILFIDIEHHLVPDSLTLPLLWIGLLLSLGRVFVAPEGAILGAVAGYVAFWLIDRLGQLVWRRTVIGQGDFKLFSAIGAWLGWSSLPHVLLLASSLGAVIGVALIAGGWHERSKPLPFGPFLLVSATIVLMWGDLVSKWLRFLP
jgi:leader peptidase (prepilin peptidase)/N-methyltransferase